MNNAGTVLLTIADMSVIEAEVEVDETDIPNVKLGQMAKITIDAMPGKTFTGKVTEIGNSPIQAAGAAPAAQATNFKVEGDDRRRDSRRPPGLHLHGRDHDGDAQGRRRGPDPGDDGPRDGRRRRRATSSASRDRRAEAPAAAGAARRRAEARARSARSSKACSSCATTRRMFTPVKTGIAGEKYFEVLSGAQGRRPGRSSGRSARSASWPTARR